MYQSEAAVHSFRNPLTGALHILASSPGQKTLDYPDDEKFPARGLCGYRIHLDVGDLEPHREPLTDDEYPRLCGHCARHSFAVVLKKHSETDD